MERMLCRAEEAKEVVEVAVEEEVMVEVGVEGHALACPLLRTSSPRCLSSSLNWSAGTLAGGWDGRLPDNAPAIKLWHMKPGLCEVCNNIRLRNRVLLLLVEHSSMGAVGLQHTGRI
jgi:predicted chitinase